MSGAVASQTVVSVLAPVDGQTTLLQQLARQSVSCTLGIQAGAPMDVSPHLISNMGNPLNIHPKANQN